MRVQEYEKPIAPIVDKSHGYLVFYDPAHPLATSRGRVYLHRHIASQKIGRWLVPSEHVHHVNGDNQDNDPSNLAILTHSQHSSLHASSRRKKVFPKPCRQCGIPHYNKNYCSEKCSRLGQRKTSWPTPEQLAKDISELSWLAIGRKYGVSDNAARKWARKYGLL